MIPQPPQHLAEWLNTRACSVCALLCRLSAPCVSRHGAELVQNGNKSCNSFLLSLLTPLALLTGPAVLTAAGAPQLPKRPTMPDLYGATPKSLQALRPSVKLSPDDASTGDSSQPSNPEPSDP